MTSRFSPARPWPWRCEAEWGRRTNRRSRCSSRHQISGASKTNKADCVYLANDAGHYQWRASSGQLPCFQARRSGHWHSGGVNSTDLVRPRNLLTASDDDFTQPIGPVEETRFIGRPAWRVMLAPPPRKPQPVWQVLDVESGVTLAYQSPGGLTLVSFTSLATGIAIPNGEFAVPAADG